MTISFLDFSKVYLYMEYLLWEFDKRVELIKGKVFKNFLKSNVKTPNNF